MAIIEGAIDMRVLSIIFLVLVGLYFAPAILASMFGIVVSLGVLLVLAAISYFIAFVIAGSILTAATVALAVVAVVTLGSWLPIVLAIVLVLWLVKRTNTVRN